MKFTGEYTTFAREFKVANIIAEGGSEHPTFSHVLVEATAGAVPQVKLVAQNKKFQVIANIPVAQVIEPGSVLIPGILAKDMFNDPTGDGSFSFQSDGSSKTRIVQKSNLRRFDVVSKEVEEYEEIHQTPKYTCRLSLGALLEAIAVVRPNASTGDELSKVTGISFEFNDSLGIVATDKAHLGYAEVNPELLSEGGSFTRVISKDAVDVLVKALQTDKRSYSETVTIEVGDSTVTFIPGSGPKLTARILDDSYINWQNMVPLFSTGTETFEADVRDIISSVDRAEVINNMKSVPIDFVVDDIGIKLFSKGSMGEFKEMIKHSSSYQGKKLSFKLESGLISKALKGVPNYTLRFETISEAEHKKIKVTPVNPNYVTGGLMFQVWAGLVS